MNDPSFLFFVFMIIVGSSMLLYHIFTEAKKELITTPLLFNKFIRKDNNMALIYNITCAAPLDADVTQRRLSVMVNSTEPKVTTFSSSTTDFGEFSFAESDNVLMSLVDIDDAGNVSEPAILEFVATDTIPPSIPGGFSVSLLREEADKPVDTIPDPSGIEEL